MAKKNHNRNLRRCRARLAARPSKIKLLQAEFDEAYDALLKHEMFLKKWHKERNLAMRYDDGSCYIADNELDAAYLKGFPLKTRLKNIIYRIQELRSQDNMYETSGESYFDLILMGLDCELERIKC